MSLFRDIFILYEKLKEGIVIKRKFFLLILSGIFLSIFTYLKENNKKELIYATHDMPSFELKKLKNHIKIFSQENPGVKVKIKKFKRSYSHLKDGINDPDEPIDLFLLSYPLVPVFAETNLILPMAEYFITKKSVDDQYWDSYAYPHKSSPVALLFNNKFLEYSETKFPHTREEFQILLQNLADKGVKSPFVIDTYLENYFKDPFLGNIFLKNIEKCVVDFYVALFEKKLMVESKNIDVKNRYDAFLKGEAAYIISSIEGISYLENKDPSLDFSVISYLIESEGNFNKALDYNRFVIGINSRNPDLTFKFIEFLNNQN